MADTRVSIENIIAGVLGPDFKPGASSTWSSLNHMRIIVEIEKAFGISFKPKEVVAASDFQKLLGFVSMKIAEREKHS